MERRNFKFKQFSLSDNHSAMKIGTDGVLLGAWADVENSQSIIDVGAGCGLISLMVAQRSNAKVIGIEIDNDASIEAKENVANSKWGSRIEILTGDFNDHVVKNELPIVDHIISNPPFFTNGLLAPSSKRAMARHCDTLSFNDIIISAPKFLTKNGKLSLISPIENKDDIMFISEIAGLNLSRITEISSQVGKSPVRVLWEFCMTDGDCIHDKLAIRDANNNYSDEYIELTNEFYLNF